jgi:small subunit ribosomal protein S20
VLGADVASVGRERHGGHPGFIGSAAAAAPSGRTAALAWAALAAAERTIGKASSKGVVHKNAASRKISRLATAVAKFGAAKAKA